MPAVRERVSEIVLREAIAIFIAIKISMALGMGIYLVFKVFLVNPSDPESLESIPSLIADY